MIALYEHTSLEPFQNVSQIAVCQYLPVSRTTEINQRHLKMFPNKFATCELQYRLCKWRDV